VLTQAVGFCRNLPNCRRILITNGVMYYVYVRSEGGWSDQLVPQHYFNLSKLRTSHFLNPATNAVEALVAVADITPGSRELPRIHMSVDLQADYVHGLEDKLVGISMTDAHSLTWWAATCVGSAAIVAIAEISVARRAGCQQSSAASAVEATTQIFPLSLCSAGRTSTALGNPRGYRFKYLRIDNSLVNT
jgi:hypothetical protein